MQRGVGNINPMKMAKCIMELERIKGIIQGSENSKGSNRIGERHNVADQITQKDLAKELQIKPKQMQRYKELIKLIPELQQMIENNPMKQSRVISEYERLCEVKNGRPSKLRNNFVLNTQKQIADEFGITTRQLQNLKKLQDLIPELQDMVEKNELGATVGYKIWAKMPQDEQEKFSNDIGREKIKTLTQKATQQYIDKINNLERELKNEKNKKTMLKGQSKH